MWGHVADCVECMACSDNVVRAGLTPKHIDVPTLCGMLSYQCHPPAPFLPISDPTDPYLALYNPPIQDFAVYRISTGSTTHWQADLAPKEMAASDMRNRRHVQPLLTWSTNAAHPVPLDQEPLQGTISWAS
ncbi:MPI [Cordylochernes scorpioides]|uniref:MPI n=1 Tax=Cordylochernes scorpioides TaxID=51811 RepID=A0ABY6KYA3_9ARAC|nr:MPI [Cordylochernes scorpioides]